MSSHDIPARATGSEAPPLHTPHAIEFPYTRTPGSVVGRFLAGLRDRTILGSRLRDGTVVVPPMECDPDTGEALDEVVPVASWGTVKTWSWRTRPRLEHPLRRPFAWALVQLEGADGCLLHCVDAVSEASMSTGLRVRARWRSERRGHIRDLECFEPFDGEPPEAAAREMSAIALEPITKFAAPSRLDYRFTAGTTYSRFLRAMADRRIVGQKCPACGYVIVPPVGSCPLHGIPTEEDVEVSTKGTVLTYTIVYLPYYGIKYELPYVCVWVILDGADTYFPHLLREAARETLRAGMRVEVVWADDEDMAPSLESILYFRPLDEPDVDPEEYMRGPR